MTETATPLPHLPEQVIPLLSAEVKEALEQNVRSYTNISEVVQAVVDDGRSIPLLNLTDEALSATEVENFQFAVSSLAAITGNRIFDRTLAIVLQPHQDFIVDSGTSHFDSMLGENHFGLIRVDDKVRSPDGPMEKYKAVVSDKKLRGSAFEQLLLHEMGHDVDISFRDEYYRVDGNAVPEGVDPDMRVSSNLFDEQALAGAKPVTAYGEKEGEALPEFMIPYVYEREGAEVTQKTVLEAFIKNTMRGEVQMGPGHIQIHRTTIGLSKEQ